MNFGDLHIHIRHLPHWEAAGASYFVTFRAKNTELSHDEQITVRDHIVFGNGKYYTLIAVVIMQDHVHLLVRPFAHFTLSRVMKGIKGVSSRLVNAKRGSTGTIWQGESFDRIVRDQDELKEKFFYMLNNPVKKELCADPWKYHGWWCNKEIIIL